MNSVFWIEQWRGEAESYDEDKAFSGNLRVGSLVWFWVWGEVNYTGEEKKKKVTGALFLTWRGSGTGK